MNAVTVQRDSSSSSSITNPRHGQGDKQSRPQRPSIGSLVACTSASRLRYATPGMLQYITQALLMETHDKRPNAKIPKRSPYLSVRYIGPNTSLSGFNSFLINYNATPTAARPHQTAPLSLRQFHQAAPSRPFACRLPCHSASPSFTKKFAVPLFFLPPYTPNTAPLHHGKRKVTPRSSLHASRRERPVITGTFGSNTFRLSSHTRPVGDHRCHITTW